MRDFPVAPAGASVLIASARWCSSARLRVSLISSNLKGFET
jgi:hypothetical protein